MDIDLRLPSGDYEKEEKGESNGFVNMLHAEEKPLGVDGASGAIVEVEEDLGVKDNGDMNSPGTGLVLFKEDNKLEPLSGMEFESHGDAYSFYQEYARSMGFNTAIQNSRRSKTSREFIDAKFACSRYGTKRESDKSQNKPRSRQGSQQDPENASGRRLCAKTDCKASMHVKRRSDGKWIIHRFEKEHNHELLPAQAVSEQTQKMYALMARQFAEYKSVVVLKNDSKNPFDKGRNSALEKGEVNVLLEFFVQMQSINSNFFYAMDVGEDQRPKNLLWVDAKSRHDYIHFTDVVSFDSTYVRNKYKMPLSLFIGVNQHYQFMLLGCALLYDESVTSLSWVMRTWLKAMGGQAPKVIITDGGTVTKSVISEVFPSVRHCFYLWHILGKVSETLGHVIKQSDNFMAKFLKCINRSWTDEEFDQRWQKFVDRFELKENDLILSLYADRKQWVPTYMRDAFLAGMYAPQRSESINSFFDKYVHKKTTVQELVKQYEAILQDKYEEEAKAESDTWNKQPALKSPSPFEKHVSGMYTNAVFKKFQVEVVGAVACMPRTEKQDGTTTTFIVKDVDKSEDFTVTWNKMKSEVSCLCHLFEFKGILCRHTLIVLQICGLSTIPSRYILKRWTKDAKRRYLIGDGSENLQSRVKRYNAICQRAMQLGEEGSLSQECYGIVIRALEDTLVACSNFNNLDKNLLEAGTSASPDLLCVEEDNQSRSMSKTNKKKNPIKKRKVNSEPDVMTVGAQDSLQQLVVKARTISTLDKINTTRPVNLAYFGPQQGMVPLNLMGPPRDNYYGHQQTIQGQGQLNSIAPNHDGYCSSQTSMHGLGQMEFFRPLNFSYVIREESDIRPAQDDAS